MTWSCQESMRHRLTFLHVAEEILVEHSLGLLVQRAVYRHDIALFEHVFQFFHSRAANVLLRLRIQRLIVEVEQLCAVERLKTTEDSFSDATNTDGTNYLALKVILLLGDGSNIPVAALNLLVGGNKVADEN